MLNNFTKTYQRFPPKFWVLIGTMFIDRVGGTLLQPYIALYITQRFNVGMTTAGVILGIFAISGLAGSFIGGALTDKIGRKALILFGLIFSALSTLLLGLVGDIRLIYPLGVVIGLIGSISDPAHGAMVADMLPEEKRAEGFGMMRIAGNLSWIIGPTIGGLVAARSFFALFVIDAVISSIVAVIFFRLIPETMPEHIRSAPQQSLLTTMKGYGVVLKDKAFMAFLVVSMLVLLVYGQLYNSLSVYMRDAHGFTPRQYGLLLTASAITVVLTQLWVSARTKSHPPFLMLALGTVFYMIGFTMFGLVNPYALFIVAVVVITIGEMISMPVSQVLAAKFAPEVMRGRYMGMFSLAWAIPATFGPATAGAIIDNLNPNLVWWGGGVILAVAAFGFILLHLRLRHQPRFSAAALGLDNRE